jgi:hypothetical protein
MDGRHVYILKEQFNLLPKRIQDAFEKINQIKFHDFQQLRCEMQAMALQNQQYSELKILIDIETV